MSISVDNPSDETLNRGPLALLLQREYEFPFGLMGLVVFFFNCSNPAEGLKASASIDGLNLVDMPLDPSCWLRSGFESPRKRKVLSLTSQHQLSDCLGASV